MAIRHTVLYCHLYDDIESYLLAERSRFNVATLLEIVTTGRSQDWSVSDLEPKEFACAALLTSVLKKFQDSTSEAANTAALKAFLASNVSCGEWRLPMDRNLLDDLLYGLFKQEIYRFFNRGPGGHILSSLSLIEREATTGPGASFGARGTDFYTKLFSGPLTTTKASLYRLFEHSYAKSPYWARAEIERSAEFGGPQLVRGNRLSFVPKNVDTSRCICTEPVLNMFYQQGVRGILERRLRQYFGIDLSVQQECNKDMARIGSLNGSFATIDLSSASDSVSLKMIRETFPADVVSWLELFRSPEVQLPNGDWIALEMISSMGNAYTFPLETIIFSCVVSAVYNALDIEMQRGYGRRCEWQPEARAYVQTTRLPNFGVFGDDIIVVTEAYDLVVRLLNILGFRVNAEKSFSQGPFRESCGGDYFRGYPCRGVYIKSLRTMASRYVAINRLNQWSAEHDVPLRSTLKWLVDKVRFLPVPLYENDDAGVKVPAYPWVQFDPRHCPDTGGYIYRRWESVPQKMRIVDGALKLPRGVKARIYNADGLFLAALRGDIRSETIGSRLGPARYRTKEAITPNWDWLPPVTGTKVPVGSSRLAAAIRRNLS